MPKTAASNQDYTHLHGRDLNTHYRNTSTIVTVVKGLISTRMEPRGLKLKNLVKYAIMPWWCWFFSYIIDFEGKIFISSFLFTQMYSSYYGSNYVEPKIIVTKQYSDIVYPSTDAEHSHFKHASSGHQRLLCCRSLVIQYQTRHLS